MLAGSLPSSSKFICYIECITEKPFWSEMRRLIADDERQSTLRACDISPHLPLAIPL